MTTALSARHDQRRQGDDSRPQASTIRPEGVTLQSDLAIPQRAAGLVLLAHGSGTSRHGSRNRFVAETLQQSGCATLLFDLLQSLPLPIANLKTRL